MIEYKSVLNKISLVREATQFENVKIASSRNAYDLLKELYENVDIYESFYIILLNRANRTIGYSHLSNGGIDGTVVDVRMIAKYALDTLATGVVLSHNHPSGNKLPSKADINQTKKIKTALSYLDITVVDHLILIPGNEYYSFADEGQLWKRGSAPFFFISKI